MLNARVTVSLGTDPARGPEQVDEPGQAPTRVHGRPGPAAWPRRSLPTASSRRGPRPCSSPTSDKPGSRGEPNWSEAALEALVARLVKDDFNVHVHAIGDRGGAHDPRRDGGGARGRRAAASPLPDRAPRGDPAARRAPLPRPRASSPTSSPSGRTPTATSATSPGRLWARSARAILYPIGSVARSGAVLAFGSDWSVSSLNPLEGIQVAVTRQGIGRTRPAAPPARGGHRPSHRGGRLHHRRRLRGRPRNRDRARSRWARPPTWWCCPTTSSPCQPREIARAKVLLTLLGGRPVWRDPAFAFLAGVLLKERRGRSSRPRNGSGQPCACFDRRCRPGRQRGSLRFSPPRRRVREVAGVSSDGRSKNASVTGARLADGLPTFFITLLARVEGREERRGRARPGARRRSARCARGPRSRATVRGAGASSMSGLVQHSCQPSA